MQFQPLLKRTCCALVVFGLLFATLIGFNAWADIDTSPYEVSMPKGAALPIVLQEDISTETATPGQPVYGVIAQDVYIGNKKILSRSDRVLGQVVRAEKPIEGRNGILEIQFNQLMLDTGVKLPIETRMDFGQGRTYYGGEITQGTKVEVVPYNVYRIGTYGRVMYTGPRAMGQDVILYPGERIVLILNSELKLYAF